MNATEKRVLAVDVGGSKIAVGMVDEKGGVSEVQKIELPNGYDSDFIVKTICEATAEYVKYDPAAVGMTIPGLCDAENGVWKYAPFSQISELPIAAVLGGRTGLPVYIENDVNACAIGEKAYGACREVDDFVWITVSNGIGGALFLDGKLYTGVTGNAGEIGHLVVEENTDFTCGCGRKGCLEAVASGFAISRAYRAETGRETSAAEVADLARRNDPAAKRVFERAGGYIGKAIAYSANLLNVETFIVGGGVSASFDLLEAPINAALERYVFRQGNPRVTVKRTALGYYAALIGAAAVARQKMK